MEHLFLINPQAGKYDHTQEISAAAHRLCRALGEPCRIEISNHKGHLTQLAKAAGEEGRSIRLYACGGDGTLHEVVAGAYGYDNLAVTCVPCGSGNDYIKQFAKPSYFFQMERFQSTQTRQVDLIEADGNLAVNVCSMGFDARIGTAIDAYRRVPGLSGHRAYYASALVNLIKGVARPCRVELEDGTRIDGSQSLVCVCNGSWYGGSFHPVPQASILDGILDILVVKAVSRLTVARVIGAYQKGLYADYPQFISHFRAKSLRILTPKPEPVNLDGELLHSRDLHIQVLPKALRFFAPAGAWG